MIPLCLQMRKYIVSLENVNKIIPLETAGAFREARQREQSASAAGPPKQCRIRRSS